MLFSQTFSFANSVTYSASIPHHFQLRKDICSTCWFSCTRTAIQINNYCIFHIESIIIFIWGIIPKMVRQKIKAVMITTNIKSVNHFFVLSTLKWFNKNTKSSESNKQSIRINILLALNKESFLSQSKKFKIDFIKFPYSSSWDK